MTTKNPPSVPLWSPTGLASVLLSLAALATALGAWFYAGRAARRVENLQIQAVLSGAYQARAVACLDRAAAALGDPALHSHAAGSLEISRGITLCLIKFRDEAMLRIDALATCVREVEIANGLIVPAASGALAAPPC
jgi:hypothetical protein